MLGWRIVEFRGDVWAEGEWVTQLTQGALEVTVTWGGRPREYILQVDYTLKKEAAMNSRRVTIMGFPGWLTHGEVVQWAAGYVGDRIEGERGEAVSIVAVRNTKGGVDIYA